MEWLLNISLCTLIIISSQGMWTQMKAKRISIFYKKQISFSSTEATKPVTLEVGLWIQDNHHRCSHTLWTEWTKTKLLLPEHQLVPWSCAIPCMEEELVMVICTFPLEWVWPLRIFLMEELMVPVLRMLGMVPKEFNIRIMEVLW